MEEIWKDIKGYEGLYQVSNYGRVKSLPKIHKTTKNYNKLGYITKEKILRQRKTQRGYFLVTLYKEQKGKSLYVHRIVANMFISNKDNKPCINHKNGDKNDNKVTNLEWCTYSENMIHAYATGLNHYA